jgi:hypothetical protein
MFHAIVVKVARAESGHCPPRPEALHMEERRTFAIISEAKLAHTRAVLERSAIQGGGKGAACPGILCSLPIPVRFGCDHERKRGRDICYGYG